MFILMCGVGREETQPSRDIVVNMFIIKTFSNVTNLRVFYYGATA